MPGEGAAEAGGREATERGGEQLDSRRNGLTGIVMVLRPQVHKLPDVEFSERTLHSEEEWRRAYVVLTFLSQGYIWAEGEAGIPSTIPKLLAVPLCNVSDHLGVLPILTYSALILNNWSLVDPNGPMDISNLCTLTSFTGSSDESWFDLTHVQVELEAVPGLRAVAAAYAAMRDGENAMLLKHLRAVQNSIQGMQGAAKGMSQNCNPSNFYVKIRPFLAGSKGLDAFPHGIIYEGVDPPRRQYHGTSAAQSTSVQTFDVFLGAYHTGTDAEFLATMREYMPPKHRDFLTALAALPSLREYIKGCEQHELLQCYNLAVQALAAFRTEHLILATRYIVMQKSHSVNASLETKGTGGTDFVKLLKKVRDDTLALQL